MGWSVGLGVGCGLETAVRLAVGTGVGVGDDAAVPNPTKLRTSGMLTVAAPAATTATRTTAIAKRRWTTISKASSAGHR